MINKADEIRKLLKQGKTTRYIAQKLRVSLRDVHRVREQENIDIGALERQEARTKNNIAALGNVIAKKRDVVAELEKQINDLRKASASLEAAIKRKETEVKYVRQTVEPIYFPQNYGEVKKNLETLSSNQLRSLTQVITDVINDQAASAIQDARSRMRKDTQNSINRTRRSLRL